MKRHDIEAGARSPPEAGQPGGKLSPSRLARQLMDDYAQLSGLVGTAPRRRYLWTDAFAVCNYLGLHQATGEGRYLDLALRLVDQVHHTLGRYRDEDSRRGWISGLSEAEGEQHPTAGGLRIGNPTSGPASPPSPTRAPWNGQPRPVWHFESSASPSAWLRSNG
ncbi:MAG: hypothetical protein SX243_20930 [Acidobacteriota bacterium]|nr:hypothetical protein [Acidobacteriota bacterium]